MTICMTLCGKAAQYRQNLLHVFCRSDYIEAVYLIKCLYGIYCTYIMILAHTCSNVDFSHTVSADT